MEHVSSPSSRHPKIAFLPFGGCSAAIAKHCWLSGIFCTFCWVSTLPSGLYRKCIQFPHHAALLLCATPPFFGTRYRVYKTRAPMVGRRCIHAGWEPHKFLVTLMEGGRPSPPCGAGDGFHERTSFIQACSYGVYTRTPRDIHSIRDLDPDARVWDSWSRLQFTQIQVFVFVFPCVNSASLASRYAAVFWYESVLGALMSIGWKWDPRC